MTDKTKIDLRKLFDEFNKKTGNKLTCKKLYIVPAMRYWIDDANKIEPEVITAILQVEDNPYSIKKICFNPDLKQKKMIDILKKYVAHVLTLGDNWQTYIEYRKKL